MHIKNQNRLWAAYVRAVAGEVSAQTIADHVTEHFDGEQGISQPTVSRWLNGQYSGELKPGNVAAFASAFGRPVLQAFIAADLLTIDDVRAGLTDEDIVFVTNLESVALSGRSSRAIRGPRTRRPRPPRA